jgi:hypothetical protein
MLTPAFKLDISQEVAEDIIEHLTSGTVPDEGLQFFTAGREKWIEALSNVLEQIRGNQRISRETPPLGFGNPKSPSGDFRAVKGRIRIVKARYGDGKTHLMKVLRQRALSEGFIVGYVAASKEVRLDRWDQLYQEIIRSLTSGARPMAKGIAALFDPLNPDPVIEGTLQSRARTLRDLRGIEADFASALYRYITRQAESPDVSEDMLFLKGWLEGVPHLKSALRAFGLSQVIDKENGARMLNSVAIALLHFHYSGLVLLVDEVESVLADPANTRKAAYDTIRLLIDRDRTPTNTMIVMSATPEMFTDAKKGFQSYEALWGRIRAITGPSDVSQGPAPPNFKGNVIDLSATPLTKQDYRALGDRIRAIHALAREWEPQSRIGNDYLEAVADAAVDRSLALYFSSTRIFVRLVSTDLERAHQNEQYRPDLSTLRERFIKSDEELQVDSQSAHG